MNNAQPYKHFLSKWLSFSFLIWIFLIAIITSHSVESFFAIKKENLIVARDYAELRSTQLASYLNMLVSLYENTKNHTSVTPYSQNIHNNTLYKILSPESRHPDNFKQSMALLNYLSSTIAIARPIENMLADNFLLDVTGEFLAWHSRDQHDIYQNMTSDNMRTLIKTLNTLSCYTTQNYNTGFIKKKGVFWIPMHDEAVSKKHVIYGIAPVLVNNRVTHIIGIRFRSRDIPYLFINPKKNEGVFIVSRDRTTAFGMNDITYTAYNKRTASAILQSDKWASNKDIKKEFHFVWPYIYISAMIKNTQWTIVIEFSIMDILSKLMHQHSFLFILSVPSLILMWAGVLYVATRPQHNTSLLHSIDQDENLLLAGVFHEIRTPLHGALGNLELLRNEVNSPVAVARIDVINNTMSSLMTLTNLFLTQSQAEANKSSLMHEHYDLTALLEQCLQTWAPLITKRNVALYFLADDILDVQIWGDSQQLGQIVLNLLSNAYKFTTHGLIILHTRLTVNKGGDKRLQISVSDTGCGIPEDKQKAVFQPFIKNVAAHPKYTEGTGLGLSICQQLARRMKGEIVLESEIGVGTRFILEIPLEEMSVSPDSSDTRLSGQQVALYCSSRLWEASLTRMLSHWGIQVTPHNIHALSSLQQVDKTVLVASTELPPLSSLTSTGCTVILLTPDGPLAPEISDKFIHLTAFSMTALKTLLQQQFVPKRRISVGEVLTGSSTQSTPRLLVVDDNPVNLALIHQQLRTIGYNNIDLASSGEEALTQLQSSNYALIITDFYMPKLSGEGLVLWLRQQELKTPVIATSAATVNSQEFDAILLKPFSLEQLRTTINRFLPQFDSAPSYSADVFYNDVYRLFSSEWLVERERILSAITQGDKQDFNHLMHRLKGSLLTLGWREHAEFIDTICSNLPTLTHKSWEHCWLMLSASLEHMIKYIG